MVCFLVSWIWIGLAVIGVFAAVLATSLSAGCAIRTKDRRCSFVALLSLFPLLFWAAVAIAKSHR
jgi:hypothetical protein